MEREFLDSCSSEQDAELLAEQLRSYWHAKGFKVHIWTRIITATDKKSALYCLRSELINGLPSQPII
jgi:hypothetical protein